MCRHQSTAGCTVQCPCTPSSHFEGWDVLNMHKTTHFELVPKHVVGGGKKFHCELKVHNDPSPPGNDAVDSAMGVHEPGTPMFLEKDFNGHIPSCFCDSLTVDQKLATSLCAYRR